MAINHPFTVLEARMRNQDANRAMFPIKVLQEMVDLSSSFPGGYCCPFYCLLGWQFNQFRLCLSTSTIFSFLFLIGHIIGFTVYPVTQNNLIASHLT